MFLTFAVSLHILPSRGQLCSPERVRLRRGHVRASRHRRGGDVLAGGRALFPGHLSNLRRTHAGSGTREYRGQMLALVLVVVAEISREKKPSSCENRS